MYVNLPLANVYPAGAGGSFLASVLSKVLFDDKFYMSNELGNCHDPGLERMNHFIPDTSIESMQYELELISRTPTDNLRIISGHYRNLIALQNITDFWYLKIDHNTDDERQCSFLANMIIKKVGYEGIKDVYQDVRNDNWPKTYGEFLQSSNKYDLYHETLMSTYRNWYWVENDFTKDRTITFTLEDIFLNDVGTKLWEWFDRDICNKVDEIQMNYKKKNLELYPEIKNFLR